MHHSSFLIEQQLNYEDRINHERFVRDFYQELLYSNEPILQYVQPSTDGEWSTFMSGADECARSFSSTSGLTLHTLLQPSLARPMERFMMDSSNLEDRLLVHSKGVSTVPRVMDTSCEEEEEIAVCLRVELSNMLASRRPLVEKRVRVFKAIKMRRKDNDIDIDNPNIETTPKQRGNEQSSSDSGPIVNRLIGNHYERNTLPTSSRPPIARNGNDDSDHQGVHIGARAQKRQKRPIKSRKLDCIHRKHNPQLYIGENDCFTPKNKGYDEFSQLTTHLARKHNLFFCSYCVQSFTSELLRRTHQASQLRCQGLEGRKSTEQKWQLMYETCFDDAILHNPYYEEGFCGQTLTLDSTFSSQPLPLIDLIAPRHLVDLSHSVSSRATLSEAPNAIVVAPAIPVNLPDPVAIELTLFRENQQLRQQLRQLEQENQSLRCQNEQLRRSSHSNQSHGPSHHQVSWARPNPGALQANASPHMIMFNDPYDSLPVPAQQLQPSYLDRPPTTQRDRSPGTSCFTGHTNVHITHAAAHRTLLSPYLNNGPEARSEVNWQGKPAPVEDNPGFDTHPHQSLGSSMDLFDLAQWADDTHRNNDRETGTVFPEVLD